MKTSLEWLSDFLPSDSSAHPSLDTAMAAEALTNGGFPVEAVERHGNDSVIDVEVTSNRGDCLCHLGVARELAALLGRPLGDLKIDAGESSDESTASAVAVRIDAAELCPHYTARVIRGVKVGPSPAWIARRLEAVGVRPINNVVDVTNYVMLEMGQPLHAFDLAKVEGGRIVVRNAARGESMVSLDGRKRELTPAMLVIADARRPIAVAGVMGGIESEVTGATVDVLLESARFDPLTVRRTARALAMKSDSSYRFERGIDPKLPVCVPAFVPPSLFWKRRGGRLAKGIVQAGADKYEPKSLSLRLGQLKRILLGVELPIDEVLGAFNRLSLSPVRRGDRIEVTVPSHRLDLVEEVDLIEEAARVLGYGRIGTREEISIRVVPPQRDSITLETICQTLVSSGYFEAITFSFVSDLLGGDFGQSAFRADGAVRKSDAALRPSLLPGLLGAVRFNEANGTLGAKLFEIGSMFPAGAGAALNEQRAVAFVGGDVREVRGVVEALLGRLDAERRVRVVPDSHPGLAAGACGRVEWGDMTVGFIGKIDRSVGEKLSLRELPAAAELELAPLLAGSRHVPQLRDLPRFPGVRRDVSLIVQENIRFEKIESLLRDLALPFLEGIEFVTAYRGKPLEKGTKSVTITLVFRSPTGTLTSDEVETSVQKAVAAATERLGAAVRS